LVSVLFTFHIHGVLKFKKKTGAMRSALHQLGSMTFPKISCARHNVMHLNTWISIPCR